MVSVFISYARRDASELAHRLFIDLQEAGFDPWLDVSAIEGGAWWTEEIEKAIDGCEFLLALLSTGSMLSQVCRAEQMRGLRKGKRVIPLLIQAGTDWPLHFEGANYRDFSGSALYEEALATLLEDLRTGRTGPPFGLPANRRHPLQTAPGLKFFVPRPKELEELRRAVMSEGGPWQIALTALGGMGGIGKTTLAAALCRDEVILDAFPDGVLWVTLGREPVDLAAKIRVIGQALGDPAGLYDTLDLAVSRLRSLLRERSVLLVLDDVWEADHVRPFQVEAPFSRLLITSRSASIALSLGAQPVKLGALTPEQAHRLLRERAGRDDPAIEAITSRLGYHPLALRLAGASLYAGMSGQDWLKDFQKVSEIRIDRYSTARDENLEVCFDLSLQRVSEADRIFYGALGCFPEGSEVPLAVAGRLWQRIDPKLQDREVRQVAVALARMALLDLDPQDRISMHDLLRGHARERTGARSREELHRDLLRACNPEAAPWSSLPDDGYLYEHLVWHLEKAEGAEAIHALLEEEEDSGNGWFLARTRAGQTAGYLSDVERAWSFAAEADERVASTGEEAPEIGREVRYALCRSSVFSLSADYPPEILRALVERGVWSPDRAAAYALQIPDPEQRASSLVELAPLESGERSATLLREALSSIEKVESRYWRDELCKAALRQLARSGFPGEAVRAAGSFAPSHRYLLAALIPEIRDEALLDDVFRTALQEDAYSRMGLLRPLLAQAPHLRDQLVQAVLATARELPSSGFLQAVSLVEMLPYLSPGQVSERLPEVAAAVFATLSTELVHRLLELAPFLSASPSLLEKAFTEAEKLFFPDERARVVAALAPCLEATERESRLEDLVAYTRSFRWLENRPLAFAILAEQLPGQREALFQESLESLKRLDDRERRTGLEDLAGRLPEPLLERACKLAEGISKEEERHAALKTLLEQRPSSTVLALVSQAARRLPSAALRANLLGKLAESLNETDRAEILEEALEAARAIGSRYDRALAELDLLPLDPQRAEEIAENIFRSALEARDWQGADLLEKLARLSSEPLRRRILEAGLGWDDLELRRGFLATIAPVLSPDLLRRLAAAAGRIQDAAVIRHIQSCFQELAVLSEPSPEPEGGGSPPVFLLRAFLKELVSDRTAAETVRVIAGVLARAGCGRDALSAVIRISPLHLSTQAAALGEILPRLPEPLVTELGDWLRGLAHSAYRIELLVPLLRHRPSDPLLEEALETSRAVDLEWERATSFARLASCIEGARRETLVNEAFQIVINDPSLIAAAEALKDLAGHLTEEQRRQVLAFLQLAERTEHSAAALLALAPYCELRVLEKALHAASQSLDKPERAELLASHIHRFENAEMRRRLTEEALRVARSLGEHALRAEALLLCALEMDGEARYLVLEEALTAALQETEWWKMGLLSSLVPHLCFLPRSLLFRIWKDALARSAARVRRDLVSDLQPLRFLIYQLGGTSGLKAVSQALEDAARWWP
ncbi:MAG TPA: TIR domain-containing protein [Thermoanaerobaculia bacterium]|nr:TIR domain-containing protein [Thermoanaerobaculia bacterium]